MSADAAILPDGRRLTALHQNHGESVEFRICGDEPYCDTKLVNTFERPGSWPRNAALAVGGGLAIVAVVQERGMLAQNAHLVLWRCPTVACEKTQRQVIDPDVSLGDDLRIAADIDEHGRLQVVWGLAGRGRTPTLVRCADLTCAKPEIEHINYATLVDGEWPEPAGFGFDAQHRVVVALASSAEEPLRSGLRIRIAEPPASAPVVTVTCSSASCADRIVRRWHAPDLAYNRDLRPVADPGGALVLVEWPAQGSVVRLIECESHCG